MDLKETGFIWLMIGSHQWQALENMVMILHFPFEVQNFMTSWVAIAFSKEDYLPQS
jgi:hypothetical protein